MAALLNDLRFGARLLWRAPTFTVIAVASLALGIGANAAIFSAINALLLRPVPAAAPDRLVAIFTSDFSGPTYGSSSYADALDFARAAPALSGLAAVSVEPLSLTAGPEPERVFAEVVSPNYFTVLGIQPAAGRFFAGPLEGRATDPGMAVLSHRYWQRRFAGDLSVVGRTVRIGVEPTTIVGVAPPEYPGLMRGLDLDLFVAARVTAELASERGDRGYALVGRLAPGARLEQVQAQLTATATRLHASFPDAWTDMRGASRLVTALDETALRVPPAARTPISAFLLMLAVTVGLVLCVACANVAGLLLARAADRRQEMAVRLAIGAGRGRLVRQLLAESLLLAALAGGAGLIVAQWMLGLLEAVRPPIPVPVRLHFAIDTTVLLYTIALATVTAIAFGLAPALQATRGALLGALRRDGPLPDRARRFPLRAGLVVSQVALSLLLLVLAGLFVRSLQRAAGADVGFDTRNVLIATIDPSMLSYTEERGSQLYADLVDRLQGLPGVESAAVARVVPLSLEGGRMGMRPEGYAPRAGEDMEVHFNLVGPAYFRTLGVRVARGREFGPDDRAGAEPVIVVNQAFAARYWPGQDPLARRVSVSGDEGPWLRVVGLVANTKYRSLGEEPPPMLFLPFGQHYRAEAKLHVRTRGEAGALVPALRQAVREVDPALPLLSVTTLAERTSASLLPQQMAAAVIGTFGGVALLLSLLGLYGVLAQSVAQRRREIGIRLALGAAPSSVARLILGQGWRLTGLGLAVGLALAAAGSRLLGTFLFGTSPLDASAFGGALLALALTASLAMWVPIRRALAVDPAEALRSE